MFADTVEQKDIVVAAREALKVNPDDTAARKVIEEFLEGKCQSFCWFMIHPKESTPA